MQLRVVVEEPLGALDVAHRRVDGPALGQQPPDEEIAVLPGGAGDHCRPRLDRATHTQESMVRPATLPQVTAVLFTCAGQRVDIVTAFARAGATTLAVDASELAPALYHADRRALVPRVDDPGYIDALRALVELHDVRLIVPLADLDHLVLSESRDRLGALVLLPAPETIRLCEDKYAAHRFFAERGIATPPTWLPASCPADLPSRCSSRPRRGFGSRHIYRANDRAELDFFLAPHDRRLDGAGALPRRGVLDRRLLRPRGALPERDPADNDRVEGRRIDQGHDDQGRGADRARPPRRRGARDRRARRTSSASARPTARSR